MTTQSDDLERIIALAAAEQRARKAIFSARDGDAALDKHAKACDALYNELDRQLVARGIIIDVEPLRP